MDHLPYPKNPAWSLIEIPYLCAELDEYDGLGFVDYPVRQGWAQIVKSGQWMDCPWEVAARRAQSWLYFGLLREILGADYNRDMFIRPNNTAGGYNYLLNTKELPVLLSRWSRSVRKALPTPSGPRASASAEFFSRSRDILWEVNIQSDHLDRDFEYCRIVTIGIKTLHDSLQRAILNVDARYSIQTLYSEKALPSRLLYSMMLQGGWCPSQLRNLVSDFSVATANYVAALPRKLIGLGHGNCNPQGCFANNVDEDHYSTLHTEDRCQCQLRGPNVAEIIRLITEGSIPLISITLSLNGDPQIEVIKADPWTTYTAISHVWSGGLGNFQDNKLPKCQLTRLYDLLRDLKKVDPQREQPGFKFLRPLLSLKKMRLCVQRLIRLASPNLGSRRYYERNSLELSAPPEMVPFVFWMDTLCIPVGEENSRLRAKAINSMALVYAGAQNVLVLDPELQNLSHRGLSQEQLNTHVLCSPWMTRCWTLQEGRLAAKWYAQLADGLYDPQKAEDFCAYKYKDAERSLSWDDLGFLRQETINWYAKMRPTRGVSMFQKSSVFIDRFSDEWDHLTQRSTTKREDVHCIMANMLDLSASEILDLPQRDRMKAILRPEEELPLALLYSSGPKIEDVRNRWIPSYPGGDTMKLAYGKMRLNRDGLIFDMSTASCDGFLVASSVPRHTHFRLRKNAGSETFWASINQEGTDPAFESPASIATCYILGKAIGADFVKPSSFQIAKNGKISGARFGVQRREGCILHLLYEYPFRFYYARPETFDSEGSRYVEDQSDFPLIDAELLGPEQIYQVDCG